MRKIRVYIFKTSNYFHVAAIFAATLVFSPVAYAQDEGPFAVPSFSENQDPSEPPAPPNFGEASSNSAADDLLPPGPGLAFGAEDEAFDFEKTPEELEAEARQEAFDAALQGLLPLRPEEIRKLLEHFDRTQESVQVPVYPNPKPEVAVQTIPLDPGAQPISIKVAYGHVTTVNVLDSSGAPWPIENITWAGNFEVVEVNPGDNDRGSHILRISPQTEFAFGNMSMKLVSLQTPVVLTLETSRDIVHYRFDAIIPEIGPLGTAPLIETGITITAGDKDLTSILEGIIPPGAERYNVSGVDSRTSAYGFNGMTMLRTPLTLLSPGWESSVSSADGTRVYAFQQTPVVLLSEKGKTFRARISSRGDVINEQ